MTRTRTRTGSASDKGRMARYKALAAAFSYPDDKFFGVFPDLLPRREEIVREYDRLFRTGGVWLYLAEHVAKSEFQRSNCLSDIMGFYRAFGLEPDSERPDALSMELEFMHYLIFKEMKAPDKGKAAICRDAEKKFFAEHLLPAAKKISGEIVVKTKDAFYREAAEELREFLDAEETS